MTGRLSLGYETWRAIGWHHVLWSKYRLGKASHAMQHGFTWPVGISTVFQRLLIVPFYIPNSRHMPVVRAVQWECERVYTLIGDGRAVFCAQSAVNPEWRVSKSDQDSSLHPALNDVTLTSSVVTNTMLHVPRQHHHYSLKEQLHPNKWYMKQIQPAFLSFEYF